MAVVRAFVVMEGRPECWDLPCGVFDSFVQAKAECKRLTEEALNEERALIAKNRHWHKFSVGNELSLVQRNDAYHGWIVFFRASGSATLQVKRE